MMIKITKPDPDQRFDQGTSITFEGEADSLIHEVEWIHISVEPRNPIRQQILRASRNASGQTIYASISTY